MKEARYRKVRRIEFLESKVKDLRRELGEMKEGLGSRWQCFECGRKFYWCAVKPKGVRDVPVNQEKSKEIPVGFINSVCFIDDKLVILLCSEDYDKKENALDNWRLMENEKEKE